MRRSEETGNASAVFRRRRPAPAGVAGVVAGAAVLSLGGTPPRALAQEAASSCTLRVDAPVRDRQAVEGVAGGYTSRLGGGRVTMRCGDATMNGDSAVHFEHLQRAVMLGSVRYEDTTRTLNADRVTYSGDRDLVVAEGHVILVRRRSGASLRGPRTEFYRTPRRAGRTVASGRPRMTLPTGARSARTEPFVVDSDEAQFIGDELAVAHGNVSISRSDLQATADSARFVGSEELGVLYGDPVITGEGFELTGDSIRAYFGDGELREVRAYGGGAVTGEQYEIASERIRARLAAGEIDRVWAFGDGRSIAASGRFQVAGDSLDFRLAAGALDSIAAVGEATSVETREGTVVRPLQEAELSLGAGTNWVAGDTIRASFSRTETAAGADRNDGQGSPTAEGMVAIGAARSFYAAVRDSTRSEEPSRNYVIGSAIEIRFRDGEPVEVRGREAIGVYLEPSAEGGRR